MKKRTIVYFVFVLAVLGLTYPITTYLRNFSIPWWSTLLSYMVFAVAITVVAAIVIPIAASRIHKPRSILAKSLDAIAVGLFTYAALAGLALFVIRTPVGFPYTWVRELFFPDWELFRFLVYDVATLSVASVLLRLWGSLGKSTT
jgi:hypothetical protein